MDTSTGRRIKLGGLTRYENWFTDAAGVINEDKNGVVTGAKVTFTDNTTVDFSVNKATE